MFDLCCSLYLRGYPHWSLRNVIPSPMGSLLWCFCGQAGKLLTLTIESQKNSLPIAPFYLLKALILWTNIPEKTQKVAGAVVSVALHMLFVLYIHFAYHAVVQGKIYQIADGSQL